MHGVAVGLGPNVLGAGGFAGVAPEPCVLPQCAPRLSELLPGQRTLGRPPSPAPPHTQRYPRSLGSVHGAASPGRSDRSGLEPAPPHSRDDLSTGLAPLERGKARRDVSYSVPDIPGAIGRGPALWTVFELNKTHSIIAHNVHFPPRPGQAGNGGEERGQVAREESSFPAWVHTKVGPRKASLLPLNLAQPHQPAFPLAALL